MTTNYEHILVFATNIQTKHDRQKVEPVLNAHNHIIRWNVDQEDADCVLRIVTEKLSAGSVISLMNDHQFSCTELE